MIVEILNEDGDPADETEARAVLAQLGWPNPHRLEATPVAGEYETEAPPEFVDIVERFGYSQALCEVDGVHWGVGPAS